ncbi:MAG: type II secretion system protein GspD, partial [Robiginitomaculum sp.]
GDAPLIGRLFRSKGESRVRTNLMVFLRPTIIRNSADARPLTQGRIDHMIGADMAQSGRAISKFEDAISGR